jgi:hypothetical protein
MTLDELGGLLDRAAVATKPVERTMVLGLRSDWFV